MLLPQRDNRRTLGDVHAAIHRLRGKKSQGPLTIHVYRRRATAAEPSASESNQSTASAVLDLNAAEKVSKMMGAEARAIAMYDAAFARVLQHPSGGVSELRAAIDYHMENYVAVRNRANLLWFWAR